MFSSVEGTYGLGGERYCVVSNNKCCPYEYNKEKRNWGGGSRGREQDIKNYGATTKGITYMQ